MTAAADVPHGPEPPAPLPGLGAAEGGGLVGGPRSAPGAERRGGCRQCPFKGLRPAPSTAYGGSQERSEASAFKRHIKRRKRLSRTAPGRARRRLPPRHAAPWAAGGGQKERGGGEGGKRGENKRAKTGHLQSAGLRPGGRARAAAGVRQQAERPAPQPAAPRLGWAGGESQGTARSRGSPNPPEPRSGAAPRPRVEPSPYLRASERACGGGGAAAAGARRRRPPARRKVPAALRRLPPPHTSSPARSGWKSPAKPAPPHTPRGGPGPAAQRAGDSRGPGLPYPAAPDAADTLCPPPRGKARGAEGARGSAPRERGGLLGAGGGARGLGAGGLGAGPWGAQPGVVRRPGDAP